MTQVITTWMEEAEITLTDEYEALDPQSIYTTLNEIIAVREAEAAAATEAEAETTETESAE